MGDYIDRQALLEWFENWSDYDEFSVAYITGVIKDEPSADVQPVRHGRWIETTEQCGWIEEECVECSECSNTFVLGDYTVDDIRELFKYCPNCGARMEGEQNG